MNTPVSFTTAKLLKEKGFKEGSRKGYLENGELGISHYSGLCWNDNEDYPTKYAAPTIAEVVMWLYEKHRIWIAVSITVQKRYYYHCMDITGKKDPSKNNYPSRICKPGDYGNSPTEAYSEAIEYTLKNLI